MYYTVLTASKSPGISGGLTYEAQEQFALGSSVQVPLRNRMMDGIIIEAYKERQQTVFDIKKIHALLSNVPLLQQTHIQTARWMSQNYCCSLRRALSCFLPSPWGALVPQERTFYKKSDSSIQVKGSMQQIVLEALEGKEKVEWIDLREQTGATTATMKSLVQKGVVEKIVETDEVSISKPKSTLAPPALTPEQTKIANEIEIAEKTSLLFGVTGSGKTEVYMHLATNVIAEGKQVIMLVPEILLTEHTIHRFKEFFGEERIEILHSRITPAQKRNTWRRIQQGHIDVVIGSRSALFSPCNNLGLVVIDEEHEWTYKNEQSPRYHTRETAEALCKFSGAKLLLGTATPSLEAWARAQNGTYALHSMQERYKGQCMPTVQIIDLADAEFGAYYPFTATLFEKIEDRLQKGEQSILFMNRRGVATSMLCLDCRRRIVSPDSNLPFTLHRNFDGTMYLKDHTTDLQVPVPDTCPSCKSIRLHPIGAGTQKIEEILKKKFPKARLIRADKDTLTSPEDMRNLLETMRNNEADILLGTQSIVKGIDLPGVTLAAVLLADVGLSLPHFRAGERIFQLLTQLTGRSGRHQDGEVIIQTFRPDAPEIKFAAEHKTIEYLDQELKMRLHLGYPPASKMIRLLCKGQDAEMESKRLFNQLTTKKETLCPDIVVSRSVAFFGGGKIWHIFLRGTNPRLLLKSIDLSTVVIDIDPLDCV